MGFGLCFCAQMVSDGSSATNEVHDDGDKREQEQQVNEKAADMQNEEAAEPEQNQNYSQDEKHGLPLFPAAGWRSGALGTSGMRRHVTDSLLGIQFPGLLVPGFPALPAK
jgi:hypothetical protein